MKVMIGLMVMMFMTGCATRVSTDERIDAMLRDMGYEVTEDPATTTVIYHRNF